MTNHRALRTAVKFQNEAAILSAAARRLIGVYFSGNPTEFNETRNAAWDYRFARTEMGLTDTDQLYA